MLALLIAIMIVVVVMRCFPKHSARVSGDGGDPTPKTQHISKHAKMPHVQALVGQLIIETGKHKGKTFRDVVERFPDYLAWCEQHRSLIGVQKSALLEYAVWVSETKER